MSDDLYDILAEHYDLLQEEIDNKRWAGYIDGLVKRYCGTPGTDGKRTLCDLGCGTGKTTVELAKLGYDVMGIDLSVNMLSEAAGRSFEAEVDVLWVNGDITDFELYGSVDVFTALTDTLNHLYEPGQIESLLRCASEYMNPGAVLIADVGTAKHYEKTLGDNVFYEDYDDVTLFWQNSWDGQVSTSEITVFETENGEDYRRYDAVVHERYHSPEALKAMAAKYGLTVEAVFGELSDSEPTAEDERYFIVFKKAAD